jgi:4-diphosphocytidyl-2-C-methyl-D-erythritol kinase
MARTGTDAGAQAEPAPVRVRVPAKINLYLGVGARRSDGYHDLSTVFHAVSLTDDVTVAPSRRLAVEVHGEGAEVLPRNADNLAARAARLVARAVKARGGVRVTLDKGIPVAGGLAGGSADAAAALVGCDVMWRAGLGAERLAALAAQLGSDVPFLLSGRTALGTGRGERLAPVLTRGSYSWVLAFDDEGLPTPAVYAEFDRNPPAAGPGPEGVLAALRAGDAVALGRALHNDLQPAALRLRPRLARVLEAGRELGAVGGLVSGSGPTVALLTRDDADGIRIASALAGAGVCRAVRRVQGPAVGATVLS